VRHQGSSRVGKQDNPQVEVVVLGEEGADANFLFKLRGGEVNVDGIGEERVALTTANKCLSGRTSVVPIKSCEVEC
jgi:hypothetical protein